jgi:formamidopyrimidine-DNA glycosylase
MVVETMPELPDIEVFRRYFDNTSLHKQVDNVEVYSEDILDNVSKKDLVSNIKGREFEYTKRHGKHLLVKIGNDNWMALHFGMTGRLEYLREGGDIPKHTRVLFNFDIGDKLAFVLQRKLGRISLVENPEELIKKRNLGKDALSIGFGEFKEKIRGAKTSIKPAIMNQERIAGIGNIYSDEILYQSGISSKAKTADITDPDMKTIFENIKGVLGTAIDSEADPVKMPKNYLIPHREKGGECPKCGGTIATTKISGRTSYYCPKCQK